MAITYTKFRDYPDSILIRKFSGIVDADEIIKSWNYLLSGKVLGPQIKGVINDLRECELNMDMESFKLLIQYLNKNEVFHRLKLAVIINDPEKIVFPMLAENNEMKIKVKTFSTEKSAANWIIN